MKKAHKQ